MRLLLTTATALAAVLGLTNCGGVAHLSHAGSAVTGGIKHLASSVSDPFGPDIEIVEVRESDLKEVPDGREKALAYQTKANHRRLQRQRANQPVDLPDFQNEEDSSSDQSPTRTSLLPPKE